MENLLGLNGLLGESEVKVIDVLSDDDKITQFYSRDFYIYIKRSPRMCTTWCRHSSGGPAGYSQI